MSDSGVQGLRVIVTGAASGLGRATALAFAEAGARLVIADVNKAGLDDTVARAGTSGGAPIATAFDLTDAAACAALVEQAVSAYDGLDALCNVAGLMNMSRATAITPELWDRIYAVNVRAPFFTIQAALPHLIASNGAVVNVASASAHFGHAYLAPYSSSKAALVGLTRSLAMEFMKETVRINAVAPGGMNTGMVNTPIPTDIDFTLVARFSGFRPMAEPEQLTDLILYLASPRAANVHGACFNIDGGATAG